MHPALFSVILIEKGDQSMDQDKIGGLIFSLRKEKGLTQRELAERLGVSDKAVSKWERGQGCPDVSLLGGLSRVLGVNIEQILSGELESNDRDGGNMKRLKFFVCPECGNVLTATGEPEVSCCGRRLEALQPSQADGEHLARAEEADGEWYVTFDHEMEKEHFLAFAALVTYDRVLLVRLYPEQDAALRMPKAGRGKLYFYCTRHGLREQRL